MVHYYQQYIILTDFLFYVCAGSLEFYFAIVPHLIFLILLHLITDWWLSLSLRLILGLKYYQFIWAELVIFSIKKITWVNFNQTWTTEAWPDKSVSQP